MASVYDLETENTHTMRDYLFSRKWPALLAIALLLAGVYLAFPRDHAVHATPQTGTAGDWPTYMHNVQRNGYNKSETLITSVSAPSLHEHWAAGPLPPEPAAGGYIFSQPVVSNGVVYWGSFDGYEHATNVADGSPVWQQPTYIGTTTSCAPMSPLGVVSSAAVATVSINGIATTVVYVGGGDDNLYALNASTGAVLWHVLLGAPSTNTFIWDSPAVFNNHVYIGIATTGEGIPGCTLVAGQFFELDALTGSIQHTFNSVPAGCTGGGIWSSPTIDTYDSSIYFTAGTQGSCPKGTTDTISIGIVKLSTGNLALESSWQIPLSERTTKDADFAGTPVLFTAKLSDGITHKLVGAVDKNGFFYAFDRSSLSSGYIWRQQISSAGACPQCGKGSISSAVWDGGKNLYVAGGTTTLLDGQVCGGSLQDLDPATGTIIWQDCLPKTVLGALTLVPGVIALVDSPSLSLFNAKMAGQPLFTSSIDKFYGSPVIANGVLYAGSKSGNLYAFWTQ